MTPTEKDRERALNLCHFEYETGHNLESCFSCKSLSQALADAREEGRREERLSRMLYEGRLYCSECHMSYTYGHDIGCSRMMKPMDELTPETPPEGEARRER